MSAVTNGGDIDQVEEGGQARVVTKVPEKSLVVIQLGHGLSNFDSALLLIRCVGGSLERGVRRMNSST